MNARGARVLRHRVVPERAEDAAGSAHLVQPAQRNASPSPHCRAATGGQLRFEHGKVVPPQPAFWSLSSSQNNWDDDNPPEQAAEAVFANGDIHYKNINYDAADVRDLTLYMLIEKIAA